MIEPADGEQIAAAFGLGDVVAFDGPAARGELGQVWKLSSTKGEWAVKESFIGGGADWFAATTAFNEAATTAGVPAPPVCRTRGGECAVDVRGEPVRAFGWVDLADLDVMLDPVDVGAVLATAHRVDHAVPCPPHPWYSEPVGPARWDHVIAELDERGSALAPRLARWRDEFVALEGWLSPPGRPRWCHRDLFAENVRRSAGGGLCVFDWDNAGGAEPSYELAMVLTEFAYSDADRARAIYSAYIDAGGPGRIAGRAEFSMIIAIMGHLAEHRADEWLESDATVSDQQRTEHRFDDFDERPLTRDVIDGLLDAISTPG